MMGAKSTLAIFEEAEVGAVYGFESVSVAIGVSRLTVFVRNGVARIGSPMQPLHNALCSGQCDSFPDIRLRHFFCGRD